MSSVESPVHYSIFLSKSREIENSSRIYLWTSGHVYRAKKHTLCINILSVIGWMLHWLGKFIFIIYILLLWIKTQWLNHKWKINPSNSICLHIFLLPRQLSRTFHLFLLLIFSAILVHFPFFFFFDCVLMTYSHFHELIVMWSPKKKLVKNLLLH